VLLLVSLWRPWYELRIPDEMVAQARAFTSRMGEMGSFAQQGLDQLQSQGAVPLTAWQVFEQADTALAVVAGLTLGLVLLNAAGALAARQDGFLILAGMAATALVAYKLVNPPGPDGPMVAGLLHATTGAYMALVAGLLMAGGGLMATLGGSPAPVPAPVTPLAPGQVKVWDAS
jgi:hypothetical protein